MQETGWWWQGASTGWALRSTSVSPGVAERVQSHPSKIKVLWAGPQSTWEELLPSLPSRSIRSFSIHLLILLIFCIWYSFPHFPEGLSLKKKKNWSFTDIPFCEDTLGVLKGRKQIGWGQSAKDAKISFFFRTAIFSALCHVAVEMVLKIK